MFGRAKKPAPETSKASRRGRLASLLPFSQPGVPLEHAQMALIVSSNADDRKWGGRWLEREGFEVLLAKDTAQMLEEFERAAPDVVIVGAKQGIEACTALRRVRGGEEIPILAMVSRSSAQDGAFEAGATDVVRAPYSWRAVSRRAALVAGVREVQGQLARTQSLLEKAREATEAAQSRLRRVRVKDGLTELASRGRFEAMLQQALKAPRRAGTSVAVYLLDLDRFTAINDAVGRAAGDEILRLSAERLQAALRREEITSVGPGVASAALGRLSGDEFTVFLTHVACRPAATRAARGLQKCWSEPFAVVGQQVPVSATVGVSLYPEDGRTAEELLQHAEAAMKLARLKGGGCFRFYDPDRDDSQREYEIERELRGVLERDELAVHYQPLVDGQNQRVVAAEALLRWQHPRLGTVSPGEFIPVAERSGEVVPIGAWVLRTACRQVRAWIDAGLPPIRMAVNLALAQLRHGGLVEEVRSVLAETGLEPGSLELEISERGTLRDDPAVLDQLFALKALGVRISVDDFGTGESAIVYLRRFPIDVLKIDRSYIKGMLDNEQDADLASAMVALAHRLRLSVVAEGVELEGQAAELCSLECDELQGFLFSPAVSAEEFQELLEEMRATS